MLSWAPMSRRASRSARQPTSNFAGAIHQMNTMARSTAGTAAALIGAILVMAIILATCADAGAQGADPARVTFPSMDGRTTLVGYVFTPRQSRPRARGRDDARPRRPVFDARRTAATTPRPCRSAIRCGAGCGRRWAMSRSWSTASGRAAIRTAFRASATISVRKSSTRSRCGRSMPMARSAICARAATWRRQRRAAGLVERRQRHARDHGGGRGRHAGRRGARARCSASAPRSRSIRPAG